MLDEISTEMCKGSFRLDFFIHFVAQSWMNKNIWFFAVLYLIVTQQAWVLCLIMYKTMSQRAIRPEGKCIYRR